MSYLSDFVFFCFLLICFVVTRMGSMMHMGKYLVVWC